MASAKDFSPFVPFDLYDFFGYLFPGAIFSVSLLLFYNQLHPYFYSTWFPQSSNQYEIPFVIGLSMVVLSIIVLYSLGHVIATISYIVIDRVLIDGIEGYPVTYYLDLPRPPRDYSEATFKYLFVIFNLLLILPALPVSYFTVFWTALFFLAIFVILIIQRIIVMIIHRRPGGRERAHRIGDKWQFRIFLIPAQWIIDPTIVFVRVLFGMDRKFPPKFIKLYRDKFEQRFNGLNIDEVDSDNYWLPVFAVSSADEIHDRTLHTWLHLYGFARNASAALCLSTALILCHLLLNENAFKGLVPLQIGIQWFLAVILGLRYWNLYSHYYTKGVIRAFVELETRK